MSATWAFPVPAGQGDGGRCRCAAPWPGWELAATGGWALDELDAKRLMRLGPERLAERLAEMERDSKAVLGVREMHIVWEE